MRISYVVSAAALGGAERALLDLLWSIRAHQPAWPLQLIAPADGALVKKAEHLGVSTVVLPFPDLLLRLGDAAGGARADRRLSRGTLARRLAMSAPSVFRHLRRLRRELHAFQPDLIHANGIKAQVLCALCPPTSVPVVWHLHDYVNDRPLTSMLLRLLSRRCAAMIATSKSVAEAARSIADDSRMFQMYNGIDLGEFRPAGPRLDLDGLSGLPAASPGTVKVGLMATFARWKGHQVFLEAIKRTLPSAPIRGYVIGGPIYQTEGSQFSMHELMTLAERLGIIGHVGFTGFIEDRAAAFRSLDVVVHASTQPEPFGLVIAEAMACGKAVIVSAGGGAAEIVKAGRDALVHRPGDAESLAEQIECLASDPALRDRLGAAASNAACRFDRNRIARELIPLYEQLITARQAVTFSPPFSAH